MQSVDRFLSLSLSASASAAIAAAAAAAVPDSSWFLVSK